MKETRYFYAPEALTQHELPAEEAAHALRVLRLAAGDEMMLLDGHGNISKAVITATNGKRCLYDIVETERHEQPWAGHVHLAVAPTKMMERMEWLTEKAVEVGIDEITLLDCRFSERRTVKTERLQKIMVAAMKQSRKPFATEINGMTPFGQFINSPREGHKFIAHCYEEVERVALFDSLRQLPADEPVTVLVGPEGDFSVEEVRQAVSKGYQSVHLGSSRLRTETAALMAVVMAQLSKN